MGKTLSDKCWLCGPDEQQARYHLFVKCEASAPQSKTLWRSVGKASVRKHPRAPWIKSLFEEEKATKVGEMVSLAALGGGRRAEE